MELTNEFEVAVPVEKAWSVLTDIERIAPCLPGAQLREVEGDEYRGAVKIKVGPITTSYDGAIRFTELDENVHRAVMKAEGRETRGQGNVSAVITATLTSLGESTRVSVVTDLTISGKVAQFGRGVLADVSAKLLDQFVVNLETTVLVPDAAAPVEEVAPAKKSKKSKAASAASSAGDASGPDLASTSANGNGATSAAQSGESAANDQADSASTVRHIDSPEAEPVDLVDLAGGSVARKLLKPALIVAALALVMRAKRRRRER